MLLLQLPRFSRSVDVPCHGSRGGKHPDLAVVDLGPAELAMHPTVRIETESTRQALNLHVGSTAALYGDCNTVGIEPEGEQPVAARAAAIRIGGLQSVANGIRQVTPQHPGHVGKHQTLEILVVVRIRLE